MTEEAILNTTATATRKAGAPQAWVLILAMFLPILAIIGLAPALPTLMDHFKDVPNAQTLVPLLLTTPALCIAVFGGAAGWLTDRYGRRKLMLGAMLLYGASGLAPFVFHSYPAVLTSRILLGIAEAFVMAIGNALLADYYTRDEQHKWLTAQGVVGPILGTLLLVSSGQLAASGWQWPFILYASAFPILLFGYFFLWEPERKRKEETTATGATGAPFPWRLILLLCAVTLGTSILYFVQPIHFSLVLREIGVTDQALIGRLSGIASVAVPLGALVFKAFAKQRIQWQLALSYALLGVGLLGIGLSRDYRLTTALALFQQLANGMVIPFLVAWALSRLPLEHRGRGMGLWAACLFVGQFISPVVVSAFRAATGGLPQAVTLSGAICLAAMIISLLSAKRNQFQEVE